MSLSNLICARSRAYVLFSQLYLHGPNQALLPVLRNVPDLSEHLAHPFDADDAAADHHQLFGLNVSPHAALFLDASGRLGGGVADEVRRRFARTGFQSNLSSEDADHLGHELGFLSFLAGAEGDAIDNGLKAETLRMQRLQRRFLDEHILWWLPAFTHTIRRHGSPFYTALADLTLDLVLEHRASLMDPPVEQASVRLPDLPALLDEPKTSLRDIAHYLTVAPWSGFYLTRDDIARLGRAENIPRGFGHRALMLHNLLRSAAEFDRLVPLLDRLLELLDTSRSAYQTLGESPYLQPITTAWVERLDATTRLLQHITRAARQPDASD